MGVGRTEMGSRVGWGWGWGSGGPGVGTGSREQGRRQDFGKGEVLKRGIFACTRSTFFLSLHEIWGSFKKKKRVCVCWIRRWGGRE